MATPKTNPLNSLELSPKQKDPLVNTSRKSLKKLLSTSEIPPGLVICYPLTDLENYSMLLFPRTVYCRAQYSAAVPLHTLKSHIRLVLNSVAWKLMNQKTRSHDPDLLKICSHWFPNSTPPSKPILTLNENNLSFSTSHFY